MEIGVSRRAFMQGAAASFGLAVLSSLTPELLAQAHAHSQTARSVGKPDFRFLTPPEAADFEAFSAQIIPTDETPGAREAGAVYFVDYVLSEINPEQQGQFRDAMLALADQVAESAPGAASFASLTSERQIAVMKAMEKASDKKPAEGNQLKRRAHMGGAEAFGTLRASVLLGCFSDPSMGGNKDKIGWKLIGFDDQAYWAPPFGYYDAQAAKEKA